MARRPAPRAWRWPRSADPLTYVRSFAWGYFPGIPNGALAADDRAVREIEDALGIAERSGNDMALAFARVRWASRWCTAKRPRSVTADRRSWPRSATCSLAMHITSGSTRRRCVRGARTGSAWRSRRGDPADARQPPPAWTGKLLAWGTPATGVLVETLLDRAADGDIAEAEAATEQLAAAQTDDSLVVREILLLRLHALLARAHGDAAAYAHFRDRYRSMAKTLGFEGHIAWAEAMP